MLDKATKTQFCFNQILGQILVVLRRAFETILLKETKQQLKLCWRCPKGDVKTVFVHTCIDISTYQLERRRTIQIDQFRITFDLFFKASPGN